MLILITSIYFRKQCPSITGLTRRHFCPNPFFHIFAVTLLIFSKTVTLASTFVSEENVRFYPACLNAKSKVFQAFVVSFDADLIVHIEEDMQAIMDLFSWIFSAFRLTISLKKTTKVIFTSPPVQSYMEPHILVQGKILDVVDLCVYFASSLFL